MRMENEVETAMRKQIDELSRMTVGQLRPKYLQVFGEESRSNHRQFLFRRIAWRIQALAEGGLSERARRRALEIANDADLRIRAPKTKFGPDVTLDPTLSVSRKVASALDPRLPPPGTYLEPQSSLSTFFGLVSISSMHSCSRSSGTLSSTAAKYR